MTLENSRHDAYCAFMRRHRSTVWRVCWRYARHGRGSHEDRKARAEDMAQEVWIVLWLKFDQLDFAAPEARQRRWLEKLTESVIIDLYRRQGPEMEPLTDELADTVAIPGHDLSDTIEATDFTLSPNPAKSLVTLKCTGDMQGSVEIIDMQGKVWSKKVLAGHLTEFDVSALPAGAYLVRITTDKGTTTKKLSIE